LPGRLKRPRRSASDVKLSKTLAAKSSVNPDWEVYSSAIHPLVQTAEMLAVPIDKFLAREGIDRQRLADADARFPVLSLLNLYESVALASNTPDLGLYSGRVSYVCGLNLQLYMSTVCDTFREYLNLIPSVLRFAGDIGEVNIRAEGDYIRLEWHPLWEETASQRFLTDNALTSAACIVNSLCVQPIPVLKACFSYPKPDDLTLLRAFFGDDLSFDQDVSCLYFARASLDYPLTQLEQSPVQSLGRSFDHLFEEQDDPFLRELRNTILKLLPVGEMTIDTVAQQLNVSRRTLQRRLADKGTQFLQVLQSVRSEQALRYLTDTRLGITDIACLLGYKDQSSFSSAFKGWHSQTPSEYRQSGR
jgi:AraC-like DNA-binding protein